MTDPDNRIVEYERLNLLGKAVYVGGQVARSLGLVIEAVVERTADIIGDAERAFREALDGVEDAKILEENIDSTRTRAPRRDADDQRSS